MDLKEISAEQIMSTDLTTVSPDEKLTTAEIMMIKKNIGGLPVVRPGNELIGIITQRDIQLSRFSVLSEGAFHVDDLMSKNPYCCKRTDKFPTIIQMMIDHNIERVPIVDDQNRCIGIIVPKDIIRAVSHYLAK